MSHDSSLLPKIVRQPCPTSCCIKHRTSLPLSRSPSSPAKATVAQQLPFTHFHYQTHSRISLSPPLLFLSFSFSPSFSFQTWHWAVNGNCFSENGQLFLGGTGTVASFKLIVRPNAKINFFLQVSNTGNSSSSSSSSSSTPSLSAPRERNGHLNSNRKTFAHIEVTLKCALNLISVRRLSRAPNSLSLSPSLSLSLYRKINIMSCPTGSVVGSVIKLLLPFGTICAPLSQLYFLFVLATLIKIYPNTHKRDCDGNSWGFLKCYLKNLSNHAKLR